MNAMSEVAPIVARRVALRLRLAEAVAAGRDLHRFADRSLGPIVDLIIRLWLAQTFWFSGVLKVANWDNAL